MTVMGAVVVQEILHIHELLAQPLGIAAGFANEKGGMLGEAGLVHIDQRHALGRFFRSLAIDEHRDVAGEPADTE